MKAYLIAYNNPDSEGLSIIGIHSSIESARKGIQEYVKWNTDRYKDLTIIPAENLYFYKKGITIYGFIDQDSLTEYYINQYEIKD